MMRFTSGSFFGFMYYYFWKKSNSALCCRF